MNVKRNIHTNTLTLTHSLTLTHNHSHSLTLTHTHTHSLTHTPQTCTHLLPWTMGLHIKDPQSRSAVLPSPAAVPLPPARRLHLPAANFDAPSHEHAYTRPAQGPGEPCLQALHAPALPAHTRYVLCTRTCCVLPRRGRACAHIICSCTHIIYIHIYTHTCRIMYMHIYMYIYVHTYL